MNVFLVFVLLANLVFAHLPPSVASLRRSAAHKKRLDFLYSSPNADHDHRRSPADTLSLGDEVVVLGQDSDGILSGIVNGVTTNFPADPTGTPISDTPSASSESPTQTPSLGTSPTPEPSPSGTESPASSDPAPSSTPEPTPSPSGTEPPASSNPAPSSTPEPTPSFSDSVNTSSQDCGLLGLGLLCSPSSSQAPPSTEGSPSPSTSNPPESSNPPQTNQSPSSTDTPSPTTTGDLCSLLGIGCPASSMSDSGSTQPSPTTSDPAVTQPSPPATTSDSCLLLGIGCPPSSTSVSSDFVSTQPPPASSDAVSTQPPPVSSDSFGTQQPPSTTGDLCLLLGINCPPSSTSVSSDAVSTQPPPVSSEPSGTQQPPSTTGDLCLLLGINCPLSSTPASSDPVPTQFPSASSDQVVSTQLPPSTTTGDLCILLGIGCPSSPIPSSSDSVPTQSPPTGGSSLPTQSPPLSSGPVVTESPPLSTTGDLCSLLGIGCPSSSIPLNSNTPSLPVSSESSDLPISTSLPNFATPLSTSEPSGNTQLPSTTPSSDSSTSIPSVSFPSESPLVHPSSTTNSLLMTSGPTSSPTPTNTQFEWLTQSSLIFSSFSTSTAGSLSLTDPDQVPTTTSSSPTGTPSVAPSVIALPPGIPARIVPGSGGVNPLTDDLRGYSMIAILFDQGISWGTVVQSSESSGQVLFWTQKIIMNALGIASDQIKTYALAVWPREGYKGPSDMDQLGTLYVGYIADSYLDTLAVQIKTKNSNVYTASPSPYSDLAHHFDPSFDITTVTATANIPGSGGSNNGSSGGTSEDPHVRENAIIGVVSALGGITLIILGYLIYRAVQKRRELAHRRLSDPPTNPFTGEAPPNRTFDQDSIGGQRRRSFYFAEDSLRGFSDSAGDSTGLGLEQISGLNRRPIAGNIGPPVMRENSLNF